mmetsp:Transcript_60299/g.73881  ORF Transcript_60299/g.73881 Transcript_60299/m.73881 type:complete len:251 (-) Transcript_60299:34-786(-)
MPLITWKICVQEGRPYPTVLREWYRGVFINAGSLSPITAVQCYANSLFINAIYTFKGSNHKLTDIQMLSCSAAAGCVSALIYGPVDLMVIQQQKFQASLSATFNIIREKYGAMRIYRGVTSTMVRESIYTMGYLGVAPVVQKRLNNTNPWFLDNPIRASVLSAMIGGTFAAILTHPVDTAKTCVQSDLVGDKYPTARWTGVHLYKNGGLPVLFKGVVPRTLRLCGACFVISQVREVLTKFKEWRLGITYD